MKITCSNCSSSFAVSDEKLPKGKKVNLRCPKCTNVIVVGEDTPAPLQEVLQQVRPVSISSGHKGREEDVDLELLAQEGRLALVMPLDAGVGQQIKKSVEELGYRYVDVFSTEDALERMRFHHFDLIIFCEGFDNQKLPRNAILDTLNSQSISIRRRIFLAIIGANLSTMDSMLAYSLSANVVFNLKDLGKITLILKKAIADNERFYKIFMDTLKEVGKS
jgi:predicted Zn finger-like uncharacterized protein